MESQAPAVRSGKSGIYSLVAAILSIVLFVVASILDPTGVATSAILLALVSSIFAIAGIIFGIVALVGKQRNKVMATVGIILGLLVPAVIVYGAISPQETPASSEADKK